MAFAAVVNVYGVPCYTFARRSDLDGVKSAAASLSLGNRKPKRKHKLKGCQWRSHQFCKCVWNLILTLKIIVFLRRIVGERRRRSPTWRRRCLWLNSSCGRGERSRRRGTPWAAPGTFIHCCMKQLLSFSFCKSSWLDIGPNPAALKY